MFTDNQDLLEVSSWKDLPKVGDSPIGILCRFDREEWWPICYNGRDYALEGVYLDTSRIEAGSEKMPWLLSLYEPLSGMDIEDWEACDDYIRLDNPKLQIPSKYQLAYLEPGQQFKVKHGDKTHTVIGFLVAYGQLFFEDKKGGRIPAAYCKY